MNSVIGLLQRLMTSLNNELFGSMNLSRSNPNTCVLVAFLVFEAVDNDFSSMQEIKGINLKSITLNN